MTSRRYLNFDLLLDEEGEGQYQALVTESPLGETPSVRFRLPFDALTLENLLLKLDPGRSGTRRVGATGQQQAAMDFGGPLYDAIFRDQVQLAWTRSLELARERGDGIRLRLRLNESPGIAGLPWELLYDKRTNSFVAQSERTPVVRYLDLPHVPRPLSVDGPLRVLAIISSPVDLEQLDVEAEWARIQEALGSKMRERVVVVDRLTEPTLAELGRWLRLHPTHVIHFLGHGDFDRGLREGVVYFQDDQGRAKAVSSSVLGAFLRDHDPLRLVVLNACRSARTDVIDPYGGMAQGLVQQDAMAVVAMQFPISDRAAIAFTGAFYGALADGLPVDQSASSARKALLADYPDEWATPVLFLRSPDGDLFTNVRPTEPTGVEDDDRIGEVSAVVPVTEVAPAAPLHRAADPEPPPEGSHGIEPAVAPPPPPAPTPSTPRAPAPPAVSGGSWLRGRRAVLALAGIAVAAVATTAVVTTVLRSRDDPVPPDGGGGGEGQPAALKESQLLVAAGTDRANQHLWLVDLDEPDQAAQLTFGAREWGPSLSPDRTTVIFSQVKPTGSGIDLMVAPAPDFSEVTLLFDEGAPEECAASSERPAWFPDGEALVTACDDLIGGRHLVMVTAEGEWLRTLDPGGSVDGVVTFGDPAISRDGSTIAVWGSPSTEALGGSLYLVDIATGRWTLGLEGSGPEYSDAVFSPTDDLIAFRGVGEDGDYAVAVATVADGSISDARILADDAGKDQDPMFSPDGQQVVFGHVAPGAEARVEELRIVDVFGDGPPRTLESETLPQYQSVPAWSRR